MQRTVLLKSGTQKQQKKREGSHIERDEIPGEFRALKGIIETKGGGGLGIGGRNRLSIRSTQRGDYPGAHGEAGKTMGRKGSRVKKKMQQGKQREKNMPQASRSETAKFLPRVPIPIRGIAELEGKKKDLFLKEKHCEINLINEREGRKSFSCSSKKCREVRGTQVKKGR